MICLLERRDDVLAVSVRLLERRHVLVKLPAINILLCVIV